MDECTGIDYKRKRVQVQYITARWQIVNHEKGPRIK